MVKLGIKLIILFLFLFRGNLSAQTIGFGCFGFTGGYAGYSYQKFQPTGLNEYIRIFNFDRRDSLNENLGDFGTATGFRVGVNFFRKKFKGFIISGKGYYQMLIEKEDATEKLFSGDFKTSYELKFTNWGIGLDLGIPVVSFLNWKIADAALLYNQVKLSSKQGFPNSITITKNYRSDFQFSYSIGTGVIIEIYGEYITLEGLAAYSKIIINGMKLDDGTILTINENSNQVMNNFISDGGFNAVIQLNIGIPL